MPVDRPTATPVGGARLCERASVIAHGRWLGALDLLEPVQVLMGDFTERDPGLSAFAFYAVNFASIGHVGSDDLGRGHMGTAFVVEALLNAPATRAPAIRARLQPRGADTPFDLPPLVAKLGFEVGRIAALHDDD